MKRYLSFAFAAAALAWPGMASAQTFPGKTVRFIVPFPGGGINDILARVMGDKLQPKWGHPIVVENMTGAGGNIGAAAAAQAAPDGHTLLIAPPGPLSINQTLYKKLTYKPEEFSPVTVIGKVPNVVIVKNDLPVNSLKELIEHVKKNPGKVVFGSQGNGATPHLTANLFMTLTGTQMVHVPYRGETLVLQDMLGGRIDLFFGNISAVQALWKDGKVKVLAVADGKRAPEMPNVPTTAEAGLPGLVSFGWFAAAGPPRMPAALAERISDDMAEVLKQPDVQQKLRAVAIESVGGSPKETAAFFKEEATRWGDVIRKTGVSVD
jgi:tripartite-type tricarboxylate transporter receptor subunit TctC